MVAHMYLFPLSYRCLVHDSSFVWFLVNSISFASKQISSRSIQDLSCSLTLRREEFFVDQHPTCPSWRVVFLLVQIKDFELLLGLDSILHL